MRATDPKIYKGTRPNIDSYSAFFDNCKANDTGLTALLEAEGVTDVYCCGVSSGEPTRISRRQEWPAASPQLALLLPRDAGSLAPSPAARRSRGAAPVRYSRRLSSAQLVTDIYSHLTVPCGTTRLAQLVTDICVKSSALHGAEMGFHVSIIEEACRPLDEANVPAVKEELRKAVGRTRTRATTPAIASDALSAWRLPGRA